MTQLVAPIDIEDALRIDVGRHVAAKCCAPPAPDNLTANTVCFTSLGGGEQTSVSYRYRVSVDCWGKTWETAMRLALKVCGVVASLSHQATATEYKATTINATPYLNPDPERPTLPRVTFAAEVAVRGTEVELTN